MRAVIPARVLFVCSGNTCRSPLAAAIAARLFRERGLAVAVASAGLQAQEGRPADPRAVAVAARRGLDLGGHRSRPVLPEDDGPATLWVTMTGGQAAELRARLGGAARVEPLLALARGSLARGLPDGDDIADPYAGDAAAYEAVAATLETALAGVADAWAAPPAGRPAASAEAQRVKTLALPRLGGLRPTLESTAIKLLEEAGELAEVIGKYRALSGERAQRPDLDVMAGIGLELLDVAQTAITMMFVLEEQYGADLQVLLRRHVEKLAAKGYLDAEAGESAPRPAL